MSERFLHKSVLLQESIDGLDIQKGDVYLDGTLGSGGHAEASIARGAKTVIGLDRDKDALSRTAERLHVPEILSHDLTSNAVSVHNSHSKAGIILRKSDYRHMAKVLDELGIEKVNKIMLDLGLSSDQFETSRRGFSFKEREPLMMTFDKHPEETLGTLTAKEIVNKWAEESLADVIYGYGEERYARRIAKAIVTAREVEPIRTTHDLVEIVKKATPFFYHRGRIHPATRTFQALRIAVNDELNALKEGLRSGFDRLAPGGRMAVISFHSLEDRIVKNMFKEWSKEDEASMIRGKIITKRPITASPQELSENPRARSAKLRIIEKI